MDFLPDVSRLVETLLRASRCCVTSAVCKVTFIHGMIGRWVLLFHPKLLHLNNCHDLVVLLWIADIALVNLLVIRLNNSHRSASILAVKVDLEVA